MIFPNVRISELEKDKIAKQTALSLSSDRLSQTIKKKTNPINFVREHPRLVFGFILSALSANRALNLVGGKVFRSNKRLMKLIKLGWTWKLLKFGMRVTGKSLLPLTRGTVRFAFRNIMGALRARA